MSDPINLNKARKAKNRAEGKRKADENALRFGQTKAERLKNATASEAAKKRLDQLKFDDE